MGHRSDSKKDEADTALRKGGLVLNPCAESTDPRLLADKANKATNRDIERLLTQKPSCFIVTSMRWVRSL